MISRIFKRKRKPNYTEDDTFKRLVGYSFWEVLGALYVEYTNQEEVLSFGYYIAVTQRIKPSSVFNRMCWTYDKFIHEFMLKVGNKEIDAYTGLPFNVEG